MLLVNSIPAKFWGWIAAILLLLCLGLTAKYAWELKNENSSLESSVQILEKTVEKSKELNQVKFDSLQKLINIQEGDLQKIQGQMPKIIYKIETINSKQNEKKLNIMQFTSGDSLALFFAKRYPGIH